jgi:hypothetical protein
MESATDLARHATRTQRTPPAASRLRRAVFGGGIEGNEQLTAIAGVVLIVLFAGLGVTILRIGQLIWLHLFLGLLLLGPVLLKVASTAYRFTRYYLRAAVYVAKGPPTLVLRAIGPILVLSTVVVFASGVVLLFDGPRNRAAPLLIHKASFILWLGLFGLHLLAHVPGLPRSLRAAGPAAQQAPPHDTSSGGAAGRWIVLVGTVVAGAVLAIALIPHFSLWTSAGALPHQHER